MNRLLNKIVSLYKSPSSAFRGLRGLWGQRGITLVELITAMAVSGVLAIVTITFIAFSSKTLRKITAMQLMQQESSVISEIFMREVRNGVYVAINNESLPPEHDTSGITSIMIYQPNNDTASFAIEDNLFLKNWHSTASQVVSSNLWPVGDIENHFTVFKNGDHVEFYLNLFRTVGDDTIFLSHTVGDVRCKN